MGNNAPLGQHCRNDPYAGWGVTINLNSEKLGKQYTDRNAKLCTIITKIAKGLKEFSTDNDTLGDAYEYLIGQFAAGSGKKSSRITALPPTAADFTFLLHGFQYLKKRCH